MRDLAKNERIRNEFSALLGALKTTWESDDIAYVQDIYSHGEYSDALENLIAIGLRKCLQYNEAQIAAVIKLAAEMKMLGSPFLEAFREMTRSRKG